jgi:hypothetical protein
MEIERTSEKTVSLCEKFETPTTYTYTQQYALLEQRFNIAKNRYFPNWTKSWWDIHIPENKGATQIIEWYTHMPREFLVTSQVVKKV